MLRLLLVCSLFLFFSHGFIVPPSLIPGALYPDWAHHHWVWLSSDQANQTSELDFVHGFISRNVPVGAVDIDSEWSTGINNFVWDTKKYPDAQGMIDKFHSWGVRVICWATSVIDTNSPNYIVGKNKSYFVSGLDGDTIKWWHGHGSFIDYTNPDGLRWWHDQMDNVIDMGIDGWKTDGTDPFIFELIVAWGKDGIIEEGQYAKDYYTDFFNYTRSKNPDALIMSRPVDSYGPLYWSFSPRDVVFSGWVGDQDPTFEGLQDALRNMFHSAWRNYVNFGSDIGGYRTGGPPPFGRTKELFLRWAQVGAFNSLMENGGDNQHRPWKFDNTNETLDIYRTYVHIHYELNPYLLNAGTTAYETGVSVMKPLAEWTDFTPDTWNYMLWHDILVCPIVQGGHSTRRIEFPDGNDWVDWWNASVVYHGGDVVDYPTPLSILPVFHRHGSLLPLNVTSDVTGHPIIAMEYDLLLSINHVAINREESATVRTWRSGPSQEYSYVYDAQSGTLRFQATAHPRSLLLRIAGVMGLDGEVVTMVKSTKEPSAKRLQRVESVDQMGDDNQAPPSSYALDRSQGVLWISTGASGCPQGLVVTIEGLVLVE